MAEKLACVYTAVAGSYDPLREHPEIPGVDWIAFTDSTLGAVVDAGWELRPILGNANSPRMLAKWYKVHPNECLPDYDRTVWVDASVELHTGDVIRQMLEASESTGLAMLAHPERDCIYEEAIASLDMPKYQDQPLLQQVAWYRRMGHPTHWGLWAGTIIGRDNRSEALMRLWWREILNWSYQDQLSLPQVLRISGSRVETVGGDLYHSPSFQVHFQPEAR